ncbi:MAG: restriction endonuclease, partial [Halobacteriales archaeon]|nr:restriction endonuclease [Halobacteriales archaeon]
MHMSELAPLVQTLFRLQGFEPEATGTHVLLFRRGTERVALRVRETKDALPAHVATELAETLPLLGHGVFATLGDVGHEARVILERGGIDVWTRDKLIHEVGKSLLEAAEHGRLREALALPPSMAPALVAVEVEAPAPPAASAPAPPPA